MLLRAGRADRGHHGRRAHGGEQGAVLSESSLLKLALFVLASGSYRLSFPASTTSALLVARTTFGRNVKIVDNEVDLNAPLSKSLQASFRDFLRLFTLWSYVVP